jgi:hypothetical protein
MKISNKTLDILKNFSEINQSILIKAGKKLKTVSTLKNILAHAEVEEDFPQDFAIYNLNEFIGLLSILNEPDLTFNDKYLTVSINDDKVKYFYADPTFIVKPEKELTMPECEINFDLTKDTYLYLNKMATILQLHDIQIKGCPKSNKVYLCLTNKKDNTSNDYSRVVGNSASKNFNIFFKRENLKIIPGDYIVSISSKGISHFKNQKDDLEYWIALEPDSKYGA